MIKHLNKAESTLDICMYILTHRNLCNALIEASYRGVKIRCIVDKKTAHEGFGAGEMVGNFRRKGELHSASSNVANILCVNLLICSIFQGLQCDVLTLPF